MIYRKNWIEQEWSTEIYQAHKQENFEILDRYLNRPPLTILDIGCGLAWESRLFNQKYGSWLWLLDGDSEKNTVTEHSSEARYHDTAQTFLRYYPMSRLKQELLKLGTQNFKLIDCDSIDIADHIKFDLITSWVSCGFHYPVSTYRDLIIKHSRPDTRIIMDLRKFVDPGPEITIRAVLNVRPKYQTCEIAFR